MNRWLLPLAVLLVLGGGSLFYVVNQSAKDEVLCEAVNDNRAALRNLLVSARNQTPKSRLTKRAKRFYREQIAAVTPLDCGTFNRDSLRRLQRSREKDAPARGGDASATGNRQQPP